MGHDRLARPPGAERKVSALPALVGVVVVATAALVVGAYGIRLRASRSLGQAAGLPVSSGSATSPGPTPTSSGELVASDRGLTLAVGLDRLEVAPGASIRVTVTIRNGRSAPVTLSTDQSGAVPTMDAVLPLPLDPSGRVWDGIAGQFKTYALTEGHREGGAPATSPRAVHATVTQSQPDGDGTEDLTLAAGATLSATLT